MTDAGLISERLRKKSLEKKAAEQHKREEMLREYNRRLRENEKSPFFLSEVQKKEVREYWESHTNHFPTVLKWSIQVHRKIKKFISCPL